MNLVLTRNNSSTSKKHEPLASRATSGMAHQPLNYGKKHLLNYLDFCKTQKNYAQLVGLINDTTEIKNPKAYISWAEKPRSIWIFISCLLVPALPKRPRECG